MLGDISYTAPLEVGMAPLSTKLRLFHANLEKYNADTELKIKRVNSIRQQLKSAYDWKEFDDDKKNLKKMFTNSNKIVKENKASISRFFEKIREKAVEKSNLEYKIIHVRFEMNEYKKLKVEMEKFVAEYSIYEKYLQSVAQSGTEFNSVGDILNRYETLEHTRKECTRILEGEMEEASALRREMSELLEEKVTQLKKLANSLVFLKLRQRQTKERRMHCEHKVVQLKNMVIAGEDKKAALNGGVWDLYRKMCDRRQVTPTAQPSDIEAQMDFIQKTITFYKEVNTIAMSVKQVQVAEKSSVNKTDHSDKLPKIKIK